MSDNKYTLPGLPDWSFRGAILSHKIGAGFRITEQTSAQEIAEDMQRILGPTTFAFDEAAFAAVTQAVSAIDWAALFGPYPVPAAPLLNAVPVPRIDSAAINAICGHLETAYYAIKKL